MKNAVKENGQKRACRGQGSREPRQRVRFERNLAYLKELDEPSIESLQLLMYAALHDTFSEKQCQGSEIAVVTEDYL